MEHTEKNAAQTRRNAPISAFNCKDVVFIIASAEWPQNANDGVLSATGSMPLHYADRPRHIPATPLTFVYTCDGVMAVEHFWTATKKIGVIFLNDIKLQHYAGFYVKTD